jgi:hypothetical protein
LPAAVDSTSRVTVLLLFKEDKLAVKGGPNPGPRHKGYKINYTEKNKC